MKLLEYGTGMEFVKRQNLSELVAARIKHLIIDRRLKPGDRLPTEQEMADSFGVSRVSVREATKALSFLGIIRAAPRRGLTIGEVDMRRVSEYLGFHLALSDYSDSHLLQTRIVIETGALEHVARAMLADPELVERFNGMTRGLADSTDPETRIELDIAFHHALVDASGLGPLVAFNDLLQIFFNRFRRQFTEEERDSAVEEHTRLIDFLNAGDLNGARAVLGTHLDFYRDRL